MPLGNREVANPFRNPAFPESSSNPRQTIVAVRQSAVEMLTGRGRLAENQALAARRFEHLYEVVELGGLQAADPGRLVVDTDRRGDPISDRRLNAVREMAEVPHLLGKSCFTVVANVCGRGHDLGGAGLGADKQARLAAAAVLRFCLSDLADHWGLGG